MISSTSNQQVKDVQKLQKSSKYRSQRGLFVVEGWRIVSEMPESAISVIFLLEKDCDKLQRQSDVPIEIVSMPVLKAMSSEVTPQGVLAVVKMKEVDKTLPTVDNPLIIALDCVQDPGNLGTIIRTAEAAGVDQLVLSKGTVDLYNPKVVKSTMGAIHRMNIVTEVDLIDYIHKLKEKKCHIYAAHLKGSGFHYEADYTRGTCFLMGNEGNGLSEAVAELATAYIKIPMAHEAESLNVAMATGILVYEAVRQRGGVG